ncbi:helix-turn-helix transcriptional regulator [Clostridium sp. C8-1-8]|uniref:helix-turn-helix transcriptional regulator n=1 Tax=Clostridium sp. C8-1-8 TaxID=2698831 RepID=UPI00136FE0D9|nr:helix-turn-helix transcriptional regulator [Clostridium sp. C8-1-8]
MEFLNPNEKIKLMRKKFRVNQAELENTNMTRAFISMMESGKRNVSKASSKLLAERFNEIAKRISVNLNLDEEYFSRTPKEDARYYCENELKDETQLTHKKLDELIEIEKKFELIDLLAHCYKISGKMYNDEKDYSNAFVSLSNALGFYKELKDEKNQVFIYLELGFCKYMQNNYEDSSIYYENGSTYALNFGDYVRYAKGIRSVALCYSRMEKYYESLSLIDNKILNNTMITDDYVLVEAKLDKALILSVTGKDDESAKQYFELIQLVKEKNSDNYNVLLSILYNNIGEYYYKIKDYNKSLQYLSQSQSLKLKYNKPNLSTTLTLKAKVLYAQGLLEESLMLFDLATEMAEQYNRFDLLLDAYKDLAKVLSESKLFDKLKQSMERLMETLERNDLKEGKRFALYKLAEVANKQGDQKKCDEYLKELEAFI